MKRLIDSMLARAQRLLSAATCCFFKRFQSLRRASTRAEQLRVARILQVLYRLDSVETDPTLHQPTGFMTGTRRVEQLWTGWDLLRTTFHGGRHWR